MFGNWEIKVSKNMPQKVETAMGDLQLFGAEYTPIAYLGSQQVNGINHAVLAEQLITTGKDTRNVVVITFNEKPEEIKLVLVGISPVVESGGELGGVKVDVQTDIPADAKAVFDKCFEGFVGSTVSPFAYLGKQITKGTDYIFAAECKTVSVNPEVKVRIVVVNDLDGSPRFKDILGDNTNANALGYAFNW